MAAKAPTIDDVMEARERIKDIVHTTFILSSSLFNSVTNTVSFFKAENFQRTGSFKIRGALNKIKSLSEDEKKRGVITFSSGNHAQATAFAAQVENTKCIAVMPEDARPLKVNATRSYGAEIIFAGKTSDDRMNRALELHNQHGYTIISPYDNPHIIAGQGTCGLEIINQNPTIDVVLVPIGGGGLIAGCSLAIKSLNPKIQVIGVETEGADDAYQSFRAKKLIRREYTDTIADGMRNLSVGKMNFEMIMRYVDDIITISDTEVVRMMKFFFERMKIVVEPTGAVASAAIKVYQKRFKGKRICAIISGGNIGIEDFISLINNFTIHKL